MRMKSLQVAALAAFLATVGGSPVSTACARVGPVRSAATALGTLAASLSPGTWAELTTTNAHVALSSGGGASGGLLGYAEDAAWDPVGRRLLYVGTDHVGADTAGKMFVIYSDDTNAWTVMPNPSWYAGGTTHGYSHHAVDPATGDFYHRPFNSRVVHRYRSGAWTALPPIPASVMGYNMPNLAMEFFPELGGLVLTSSTANTFPFDEAYLFKPASGQWSKLVDNAPMGNSQGFAQYDPVHKVVLIGTAGSRNVYKLDASGRASRVADAPIEMGAPWGSITTVDPVSGDFLVFGADGSFHVFKGGSNSWTLQTGTVPWMTPSYVNAIWQVVATPIGTYGVTMFVKFTPSRSSVWLYKHAAGAPPPPGDTTLPLVTITSPAPGAAASDRATIAGTASDANGVKTVTWSNAATGSSGMASGTTSWTVNVPLATGSNTITVTALDPSGNAGTATITLSWAGTGGGGGAPSPPSPARDGSNGDNSLNDSLCGLLGIEPFLFWMAALILRRVRRGGTG